ncbi:PIG-L deacetylase family protein [Qipengyuania sp.]|uniref:PIG-L deacetylase family protein n=1 Tax=Qipengyuania sp. TaxID=2004515 RepID=UPI0037360B8B
MPREAAGSLLRDATGAPHASLDELTPPGGLLVVVPHPDDEALGCGLALAAAADAGRRIGVLLLTDGEGSHTGSARFERERLIALRQGELAQSLAELAGGAEIPVLRLGLPDGCSEERDLTAHHVESALDFARPFEPRAVWTTWEHDPHCDHLTAATLGRRLASRLDAVLWRYPVWGRFDEGSAHREADLRLFASAPHLPRKRAAIAAHRSQFTDLIDDDPKAFRMPDALTEHFAAHPEIFLRD